MIWEPLDVEMTNKQITMLNESGASEFIVKTIAPFLIVLTVSMLVNKLAVPAILLKAKNFLTGLGGRFSKLGKTIVSSPLTSTAVIATGTGLIVDPKGTLDVLKTIPKIVKAVPFVLGGYFLYKFLK